LRGDFDGNRRADYAVKFVRGPKGFMMAFLNNGRNWKPFFLHIWKDSNEARYSDLVLFKKGERDEHAGRLRVDAPADYHCESDVGGIHVYRKGRFIAY